MTSPVVCDATAIVAVLLDAGEDGTWSSERISGAGLYAPALLPFECSNVMRRLERGGLIGSDQAAQAHIDLLDLPIEYWPYDALSQRIWELRDNLSSYDAAYVALAEELRAPLITLDRRVANAPGLRCTVHSR